MDLFSTVKTNISTINAAERYGIEVKRNGKALCPFHNDRHPSLFVGDDHYHCYACGEHGDSIDLVAKLYDLPLHAAARKLASDFGLTPDKTIQKKQNRKSEAQRLRENGFYNKWWGSEAERLSYTQHLLLLGKKSRA